MLSRNQFFLLLLKIINYLTFYVIWVGCLYAAVHGLSLVAALLTGLYLIIHLSVVSEHPFSELKLIVAIIFFGLCNDIFLTKLKLVQYIDASSIGTSWWMTALWGCFGSTYWHAFSWLESRKFLACILGFVAVPFCYLWGVQSGVVLFPLNEPITLSVIGSMWAFLLPLSFIISRSLRAKRV